MRKQEGDRVLAIFGSQDDGVHVFGAGVYVGDKVPGEDPAIPLPVGFVAEMRQPSNPNPLIKLDSGQYVWGCECWWGPEAEAMKRLEGQKIITDDIDAVRAKHKVPNTLRSDSEEYQRIMRDFMKKYTVLFFELYHKMFPEDAPDEMVPNHFYHVLAMTCLNTLKHTAEFFDKDLLGLINDFTGAWFVTLQRADLIPEGSVDELLEEAKKPVTKH